MRVLFDRVYGTMDARNRKVRLSARGELPVKGGRVPELGRTKNAAHVGNARKVSGSVRGASACRVCPEAVLGAEGKEGVWRASGLSVPREAERGETCQCSA